MWSKQQTLGGTTANSALRSSARLGSTIQIKGEITGSEDLQIDGTVEGPIALGGHELVVGSAAQLNSEVHAGEVIVCGKLVGNVHARGRVEITKEGSITGDLACARISIEDGAHFKGRIEIDPTRSNVDSSI
jgi:cytoskeletal protein CcmA (bactofilin family)